jgi:hypothetical protein
MNARELKQRLTHYEKLMRLDKPIGTLLLLWPTFWALWLSTDGQPHILLVWIFALGTLLMRSAGCVINDYADRDFDPHVKRTRERPLAAGTVSVREVLVLFAVLCLCALLVALPILREVWHLTLVALFLAASYPFTKRFFALPQAYLGVAFGFGIPMAFAAATGEVGALGWTLAGRQRVLGPGLRHRIRHGRSRRRPQDRHPHCRHHIRPLRRRRRDELLCGDYRWASSARSAGTCNTVMVISADWYWPQRSPPTTTR